MDGLGLESLKVRDGLSDISAARSPEAHCRAAWRRLSVIAVTCGGLKVDEHNSRRGRAASRSHSFAQNANEWGTRLELVAAIAASLGLGVRSARAGSRRQYLQPDSFDSMVQDRRMS